MGITLIRCSELVGQGSNALVTPPVGVAYLAAALRQAGHGVRVIDAVGEALGEMHQPGYLPEGLSLRGLTLEEIVARVDEAYAGVLGISCMFSQEWPVNRRLIELLRARFPRAVIVCGGEHVSALAEFVLESCRAVDYCIRGEGERAFVALAGAVASGDDVHAVPSLCYRDAENRPTMTAVPAPRLKELDTLPWPAWDLVPIENYLSSGASFGVPRGRSMPIVATRGCPFSCTFCSNPQMWGTNWVAREPKAVVDEMEEYVRRYRAVNFDFYDLTAIVRKDWILAFCAELEARGLRITYQLPSGTRSEAIDAEVTAALARTGCCHIVYAPESGSAETLKRVRKRVNLDNLCASMRAALATGLFVKMNIVIGFPGERVGDILRTFGFLARTAWLGAHDAFVYTFSPYPGSQLYRELQASGRIAELTDDYFYSLASYIRLTKAVSYTEHISHEALALYRFTALVWFYGLSFLFHPGRVVKILFRLRRAESDTRIENFVKVLLRRAV